MALGDRIWPVGLEFDTRAVEHATMVTELRAGQAEQEFVRV